ncbi:protein NRT1/ PTR FAMILY 6.4-like [Phragmites australis]|uniref:protein NRT1/ PTR FAMILY 6.4-like n=1 Tax=Phragmites australis TaxID=29695 RepID=UPI002D77CA57|nr:protein NRT1/ PTR FAMILY 6.4-like [Phragmites australis]
MSSSSLCPSHPTQIQQLNVIKKQVTYPLVPSSINPLPLPRRPLGQAHNTNVPLLPHSLLPTCTQQARAAAGQHQQMVSAGGHGGYGDADDGMAVDFRGNPFDKSRTGGWLGAGLILGAELAERVCVMGISMNLVTYLVGELHLSNAKSANIVTNFMGTLNLLALVGGFLADAKFGRYLTIAISATIAATGVSMLTVDTTVPSMRPPPCVDARGARAHECVPARGGQLALLYAALYTIAAGAGGLKANVSGFGSDQFDGRDPREERAMVFFFNRFYFCISLGSLFAVTVLVYVQDNVGRGWGYGVSAVTMMLAVAVFIAGTPKYRYRRPQGSPLTVIGRVLATAWRRRRLPLPADATELNGFHAAKVAYTDRLRCLDKAAIVEADLSAPAAKQQALASTVTEVEEVKMVVNLLPIWSTCILFWTVYSQMTTFSVEQATRMDRHLRPGAASGFAIPAGSLSVFLFLSILLFTSLNERLLVPVASRLTGRPQGLTSLQRVGTGLVLAVVAMVVSALVEKKRRDAANGPGHAAISAFWLVPQFLLVGAGEAFAYVGQLEFFIREAPERMKSMSTGLFLVTLSMGFFLSSFLVFAVDGATRGTWIRNNLDAGKLDLFYWMLAVLGVANFAVFLVFAGRHEYKPSNVAAAVAPAGGHPEKEMDDFIAVKEAVDGMDV